MGFPGSGFWSTPAAVVVAVQGIDGFVPMVAAGLSQVPVLTVISGCRILPLCADRANAARIVADTARILNFMNTLRSLKGYHKLPPPKSTAGYNLYGIVRCAFQFHSCS